MARRGPIKQFPYFGDKSEGTPANTLPPRASPIAVARIKGSVDKARQLTPTFLPKGQKARSVRFRSVMQAMARGVEMPPIEVYYLNREYYVIDGHNRVAAAIVNGVRYLDAIVHECIVPEHDARDRLTNIRTRFERRTGLTRVDFTQPESYRRLLGEITAYRDTLRAEDPDITMREAAQRWYREVFVPVAEPLDLGAATLAFPGRTVSDLYLAARDHQAYLEQTTGQPASLVEAVTDLLKSHPSPLTSKVIRPLQRHARRAVWRVTGGPPAL